MSSLLLAFQNSMHVRLRGCCRCHDNWTGRFQPSSATWNWTPTYDSFISHHGKLRFSHPIFVSSTWTQRVRSLVNSLLLWTTYLLDYNYIVVPLPTGFYVNAYLNGEGVPLFLTPLPPFPPFGTSMQLHSSSSFAPPSLLHTLSHKHPMHSHAAVMEKTSVAKIRTANYTKAHPQGPGVHTVWRPTFVLHM